METGGRAESVVTILQGRQICPARQFRRGTRNSAMIDPLKATKGRRMSKKTRKKSPKTLSRKAPKTAAKKSGTGAGRTAAKTPAKKTLKKPATASHNAASKKLKATA